MVYDTNGPIYSVLTGKAACTNPPDCTTNESGYSYCQWGFYPASTPPDGYIKFTVSNAGSYVVTSAFGESEPGANDGYQAGTYSLNGTYEFTSGGGFWLKNSGCSPTVTDNCFTIDPWGYISGAGTAGFPAWYNPIGLFGTTENSACPPWTVSGWTKVNTNPTGIVVNDPAPTVVKEYTQGMLDLRSSCLSAGGVFDPMGGPWTYYPAIIPACFFYSYIPSASQDQDPVYEYCPGLSDPAPSGWELMSNNFDRAVSAACCGGYCNPPRSYNAGNCQHTMGC